MCAQWTLTHIANTFYIENKLCIENAFYIEMLRDVCTVDIFSRGIMRENANLFLSSSPRPLSCLHGLAPTRQMAHLIKLRTKGEEVLSSRLKHAQEDCKRAIERAERAEARIRKQEQELADLRENA